MRALDAAVAMRVTSSISKLIDHNGGTIDLVGFAKATIPSEAFPEPRMVTMSRTHEIDTDAVWNWSSAMWAPGPRDEGELRIEVGPTAPERPVIVELEVPRKVGMAEEVGLFARVVEASENETLVRFVPVGSAFINAQRLSVRLNRQHFIQEWPDDGGAPNGTRQAVLILTAAGPDGHVSSVARGRRGEDQ